MLLTWDWRKGRQGGGMGRVGDPVMKREKKEKGKRKGKRNIITKMESRRTKII